MKSAEDYWKELTSEGKRSFKEDFYELLKRRDKEIIDMIKEKRKEKQTKKDNLSSELDAVTHTIIATALENKIKAFNEILTTLEKV